MNTYLDSATSEFNFFVRNDPPKAERNDKDRSPKAISA